MQSLKDLALIVSEKKANVQGLIQKRKYVTCLNMCENQK